MTLEGDVVARPPANEQERELAAMLALGYTWAEAGRLAGVSRSTVQRRMASLRPYVEELRRHREDTFQAAFMGNLALAMDVERRVLSGEIELKDDRAVLAREMRQRYVDRLFFVERPASSSDPRPSERYVDPPAPPLLRLEEAETPPAPPEEAAP